MRAAGWAGCHIIARTRQVLGERERWKDVGRVPVLGADEKTVGEAVGKSQQEPSQKGRL